MNANAQLAALATIRALAVEHGEVFLVSCVSAILICRLIAEDRERVDRLEKRIEELERGVATGKTRT
jgi:hypothetical protein